MQEKEKVETIMCLLQDLTASNTFFNDEEKGIYFDYDSVIEQLQKTQNIMNESVRCPRPANLPKDMAWSERFYDPDEELNQYVYDGSMTQEDYEKAATAYQADQTNESTMASPEKQNDSSKTAKPLQYDTGMVGNHVTEDCKHEPTKKPVTHSPTMF